ncbi:MAG: hypothetical protein HN341_15035 [Verrucomicrobia bacterium]|nr:hypothetical protein [Verrucomicrobiota bacterium]
MAFRLRLAGVVLVLASAMTAHGQWVVQSVPLVEGWNAVYLSVQPYPSSCAEQFGSLPIDTVQRRKQTLTTAQFDTDPSELFDDDDEWLAWRPDDGLSGYVSTLHNVSGDFSYLIKATNACTWTVTGRPCLPEIRWEPRALNLVGFQVSLEESQQPTFAEFFKHVDAIDATRDNNDARLYAIGSDLVPDNITGQTAQERIQPGIAYWIEAQAASRFVGGLHLYTADPEGLSFGARFNELSLFVRNDAGEAVDVTMRHSGSAPPPPEFGLVEANVPLQILDDSVTNRQWIAWPLDSSETIYLAAGETREMQIALDRSDMEPPATSNAYWQSIVSLESSCGSFVRVPVSARYGEASERYAAWPSGLWVGEANLSDVSAVAFDETAGHELASSPKPASDTFPMRLILHVDTEGRIKLLSRVILTTDTSADGNIVYRLYVDEGSIPDDAESAVRISSAGFGLVPPVQLSGDGFGEWLDGDYHVGYDDPVNPFKHVYHPSHDNRSPEDGALLDEGVESYGISNHVALVWETPAGVEAGASLWNPSETTTGVYTHVISNLRQTPVTVSGVFTLRRVNRVGQIEP